MDDYKNYENIANTPLIKSVNPKLTFIDMNCGRKI